MDTTFTKGNKTLLITQDNQLESPREWTTLGTMVLLGGKKDLGDKHNIDDVETANKIEERSISLPIYMYSHSGETIATTPFSCRWDSGKIGFIYVTHKQAIEHLGWKSITPKRKAKLLEYLEGEVKTLNQWITGETYGFTLSEPNKEHDSCWGFYGSDFKSIFDHLGEKIEDWEED